MYRWNCLVACGWLLSSCGSPPPAESPASAIATSAETQESDEPQEFIPFSDDSAPETIATAMFVPSVAEIRPGKTFQIAMHFKVEPGYRLGWLFAGEVGQPTVVRFSGPPDFEIGPVRFTGPSRYQLSGGLTSYGYKDQATAFAEVRAPEGLSSEEVYRFNVRANWFACERECVTEGTEAYFELRANPHASGGDFEQEIQTQLSKVPSPLAALTGAKFDWRTAKKLVVTAKGVTWGEFFPAAEKLAAKATPQGEELHLDFTKSANQADWVGVAKASVDGEEVFVDLRSLK